MDKIAALPQGQTGLSLIEMVVFIAIIGIIASGLLVGLNQSIQYSGISRNNVQASFLANARMQVILMNRNLNGYAALNDPCTTSPGLSICTPLSTYASTYAYTVSTPSISGSNPKTISITVSGTGDATIQSRVFNYGNN